MACPSCGWTSYAGPTRALLGSLVPGRVDEPVAERIIAEARGNPRALVEQLHGVTPAQFAGGFGVPTQGG